jgi:hypothetical protein
MEIGRSGRRPGIESVREIAGQRLGCVEFPAARRRAGGKAHSRQHRCAGAVRPESADFAARPRRGAHQRPKVLLAIKSTAARVAKR